MTEKLLKRWVVLPAVAVAMVWGLAALLREGPEVRLRPAWQTAVNPGHLTAGHAFLANNCIACHTPNKGVQAANCIACHANDRSLLQRQPTAFHADVQSCVECHAEHQGLNHRPALMDHAALARIGLRHMQATEMAIKKNDGARTRIVAWIGQHTGSASLPSGHATILPEEAALSCIVCHANQDRHRAFFGTDCVQCHTTNMWTIPEYRHPPPTSTSCVQCHQAPPSHYMEHFRMVSMTVARQPFAKVDQCFLCHQTTSWNDIRGVGWYKHH